MSPDRRLITRILTGLASFSLVSGAAGMLQQIFLQPNPPVDILEALPGLVLLVLLPLALGLALGWWALRGWARVPEPRWSRVMRWGTAGGFLWIVVGVALIIAWFGIAEGRDAGLAPMFAFFTSPIGFVIGGTLGARRSRGTAA